MHKNPFLSPRAFEEDPESEAIIRGDAVLIPGRAREVIDQILFCPPGLAQGNAEQSR